MTQFLIAAVHHVKGPPINYRELSPIIALTGGGLIVLLVGLLRAAFVRERLVPVLSLCTLAASLGLEIWLFGSHVSIISGALRIDDLTLELGMLFAVAGMAAILLSVRGIAPRESGQGEYHALLIFSVLGMFVLVAAVNVITTFIGLELLSIPLYIMCGSETRRESSLESGLKYLIVGSVGSATLVYGFALVYGATGSTDYAGIARALAHGHLTGGVLGDPMVFTGLALVIVGFAFKASVAPFHQWTPDVYEGAPTQVTAFMATATKAAALGVFLRFFDVAALDAHHTWGPVLAVIAAITIIVGNVGALGQTSLKRMLGYSGVGQAGYMLSGVVVGTQLGVQATVLYLMFYLAMNMAAFAVIVASEHERPDGDDVSALAGTGVRRPWLAWSMTIGMLALAGIPGTVGFVGKFQLIHALVSGSYTWLAIVLVIGSMISLGYYLRVVAAIWMRPASPFPGGRLVPVGARAGYGAGYGPGESTTGVGAVAMSARRLPPIAGGSPEADDETGDPGTAGGPGQSAAPGEPPATGGVEGQASTGGAPSERQGPAAGGSSEEQASGAGEAGGERGAGAPGPGEPGAPDMPATATGEPVRFEPEVALVGVAFAAAAIFFGIVPEPLFHFAAHVGHALGTLL